MFSFLGFLAVVYLVGVFWPKVVKGEAYTLAWGWPLGLLAGGWNKLFGADSVFNPKPEAVDPKDPE